MASYELLGNIELTNVLKQFERNILKKINCVKIGTITAFNSTKNTVSVNVSGYSEIQEVPFSYISGTSFSIQVPIQAGDICILLCNDTDLDNFMNNNGQAPAFAKDLHGLSGCIALVGLKNLSTAISDYVTNGIRIKYNNTVLEVSDSGIYSNSDLNVDGNITVSGDVTASGDVVASGVSLKNHTHQYIKAQSADNLVSVPTETEAPTA